MNFCHWLLYGDIEMIEDIIKLLALPIVCKVVICVRVITLGEMIPCYNYCFMKTQDFRQKHAQYSAKYFIL